MRYTDCVVFEGVRVELLVLEGVRMEFLDLKGVRVELLLVLEGVRVELLVLEGVRVELLLLGGEGRTDYLGRDEGGTGVLAKPLRKTSTTRLILLPFIFFYCLLFYFIAF